MSDGFDFDYEVFVCSGCQKRYYGLPEFTLMIREGYKDSDFLKHHFCNEKCLKSYVRRNF